MPRIDPLQLLTCLKVLLDKNGGILSLNEVKRIAGLMTKYSKKLVSKCIYIQILKCTKTDLLGEFMGAGGWQLVNLWLTDGLRAMNYPLVTEILELFLLCPVDVERLKSNTSPKLVKQLSREGPPDVRILATRLVEQWLNIVKASNIATNTSSTGKTIENSTQNKNAKEIDVKTEIENNKTEKSEDISDTTKSQISKNTDNISKTFTSPKRKTSTESPSSLTLKIVVKDGKQVVSKVDDDTKEIVPVVDDVKDPDETDVDLDQQSESDESSDKLSNKENENKVKEEEISDSKENKEIREKDKHKERDKEKDKHKDKIKDKSKSSSKDKDRHKSSSSSSKSSSKSHSSSSSKNSSSSSSNSSSKSKHSSSKSSNRDKERDSDKDREKEKEHKHKSSNKSSSKDKHKHEKQKSSTKDKDKEREKEKANQAEKDKDTLNKVMSPSLEKLGKIPRKPKDPNEAEAIKPTSITIPSKKASMSIEIRKDSEKAKTVKTYKSQFRSHGLTEEAPPPPSRKHLKKPTVTAPVSVPAGGILGNSSFASSLKRSSPPLPNTINSNSSNSPSNSVNGSNNSCNSGPSLEKKPKIDMTGMPSNVVEKPGSIKLIAPKPKPSLVESDMFMDALSAAAFKKHTVTKRKRRPSNSASAESPTNNKAEPLKFYQDTLEVKEDLTENKMDDKNEKFDTDIEKEITDTKTEDQDDDDDIPLKKVKEDIDQKSQIEGIKFEEEKINDDKVDDLELVEGPKSPEEPQISLKKPPGPGCGPNGPPGVLMLHRRTGPKKKLKWKVQDELEEIRYFELDENERVNVTKAFTDMKNMERMHERETFLMGRKLNNEDLMVEQTQWRSLIIVDDAPPHPEGFKSEEKSIQAERERTTLKALYFSHAMIPDSPSEPDMEQYLITEPKIIPLDDITGNNSTDTINDFVGYGYPEPKGTPPPDFEDDPMEGNLGLSIPGTEIPFGNQNSQFNPFLPFGNQPIGNNNVNQNNWVTGLGQNAPNNVAIGLLQPNNMNMNNIGNINMLRPNLPHGGPMNSQLNVPMNGPPPLMATVPLGPINNAPFNMPHNILPFGPNGPVPNGMMNGPPQSLLGSIFGPNGIQQQRMNINGMNGPMHNQMGGGNRNNQNSGGGGNWRAAGPLNNNGGGNWRSNDRNNSRGNDRSTWVHGSGNRSVCKQFLRGFCRNGNKCNYLHPGNNQRI